MKQSMQIAKHLREVYFGGNWTVSSLNEHLAGITWEQATTKVHDFNTIATLVYHVHYYIHTVLKALQGGPLEGRDSDSFSHPPIHSAADWERLLEQTRTETEACAALIEQLPDERLWQDFADPKYGSYYRNLHGMIEHAHYHLGQIVLIKKLLPVPARQ